MSESEVNTDVVEVCALLQCLGYTVKSLDISDCNLSQDDGNDSKTVVINCQTSGLNVVLESVGGRCSCPGPDKQNSGFWQVCGVTGGKQAGVESGSALLVTLPKAYREYLSQELGELMRSMKAFNCAEDAHKSVRVAELQAVAPELNKSASLSELHTPEKEIQVKVDTPTRYRSLDTLTSTREAAEILPVPGALQKHLGDDSAEDIKLDVETVVHRNKCKRQGTYTVASRPGSGVSRNKTSSPIHSSLSHGTVLDSLISAEKAAEDLRNKLSHVIKELMDDGKNNSSMSSMMLDVSKISVLKGTDTSKAQFASSPNLSSLGSIREGTSKSNLKRVESASASSLKTTEKESTVSKLRRISPNFFKNMRKSPILKDDKENKSKLNSLFKAKIATPVRIPSRQTPEPSPTLSGSKKKFSHIKSTIPRPSSFTRKE